NYRFLGESARAFTIRWIITSTFPNSDAESLLAHNRKCMDVGRLAKTVFDRAQLRRMLGIAAHTKLLDLYIGVLVENFGMAAVRGFLEPSVQQILVSEVKKPSPAITLNPTPEIDPKQQLRLFLNSTGGEYKAETTDTPDKQWQATVMCQLVASGTVFTHARIGLSKQKATSAACVDIMNYLNNNQDVLAQLLLPNGDPSQAYPLPIQQSDYSNITVNPTAIKRAAQSNEALQSHPNKTSWANIPHSDDQEETLRQLSLLLLGNQDTAKDPHPIKAEPMENQLLCQMQPIAASNSFDYIKQETKQTYF
ncbi:hypothetical protein CU098_002451, partial [Rhizopus stolonifer]